jgi:hypothetical protein
MKTETAGLRFGKFAMAYGHVDVNAFGRFKGHDTMCIVACGRMNVLVFAWTGSGIPPEHHSLN